MLIELCTCNLMLQYDKTNCHYEVVVQSLKKFSFIITIWLTIDYNVDTYIV